MKKNLTLLTTALAVSLALAGCGESSSASPGPDYNGGTPDNGGGQTPDNFDQAALVANLVDNVITPTFGEFAARTVSLSEAVSGYCTVVGEAGDVSESLAGAQGAWRDTMAVWQQAEVMQIGPLKANASQLRNAIHSWPVVNRCAVDQDVVHFENGSINGTPYDITLRTETRKGLDALDYLLFNPNLDHSCSATTAPAGWNDRPEAERALARCQFAVEVARDLNNNANTLVTEWASYGPLLKAAGQPGSAFADIHDAVNDLSDAMFYIDSVTKDGKLDKPLQQFAGACNGADCDALLESPYSRHSIDNIEANLRALKALFAGQLGEQPGTGFDDYLIEVGSEELANQMAADIDTALTTSAGYEQSLAATLNDNPDQVQQTHTEVKAITDAMKVDFISALALELPSTSAGDND
ncbi:imelysin family protein [Ferrimonas balearica]|uniref:imelysin family protein n=1 Tax=Ferrimonas balearica TaxID=44012 RepID=UPI001C99AA77|nr:imelysin family protein [Ferrimonas balearica]MBY5990903.1 imelysin family protein [Ferrimonas balearica]